MLHFHIICRLTYAGSVKQRDTLWVCVEDVHKTQEKPFMSFPEKKWVKISSVQ